MRLIEKLKAYGRALRGRRGPLDHFDLLRKRPALLLGVGAMETAQFVNGRADARLKVLAQVKTSALIGCPF